MVHHFHKLVEFEAIMDDNVCKATEITLAIGLMAHCQIALGAQHVLLVYTIVYRQQELNMALHRQTQLDTTPTPS